MDPASGSLKMTMVVVLLSISCIVSSAQDFDFFYFVQQWPGAYCDTKFGCCYPKTGKPAVDFSIHGLWPNYNDGGYPSHCDNGSPFLPSEISDLRDEMEKQWPSLSCPSSDGTSFWSHEWEKHGTCSESVLNQHQYFQAALNLKTQLNLLHILTKAGIRPDGGSYSLESIKNAIQEATGFAPGIECNVDESRQPQLYQIFVCVNTKGTNFIDCPVLPRGRCSSEVEFPAF
ncbi:ribonuclease 1-like [Nymphaea colorata]|nr:ribonuclease 1-like [Nymphaea colorata]